MTTVASAIIVLAILAIIVQAVLFAVRHNGTERALIIGSLGTWPLLVIWAEAALVMLIVRSFSSDRSLWDLATDGGAWVMGLAGEATRTLAEAKPSDRRVGLVLGAEGGGLRRLQRETCDELVRLPISGAVESLNVSVAAAVALYELAREG